MSITYSILFAFGICIIAAIFEGLFAGKNIKPFLEKLRTPAYSPTFAIWVIIGVGYYAICFTILYRLFRFETENSVRDLALLMLLKVMAINALWNYFFFRRQSLFYSNLLAVGYSLIAIALFICLIQFDVIAALVLVPYLLYLIYAFRWGYGLWKLNPDLR